MKKAPQDPVRSFSARAVGERAGPALESAREGARSGEAQEERDLGRRDAGSFEIGIDANHGVRRAGVPGRAA